MPRDAVPVGMVTGTRTPVALVAVLVLLAGCAGAGTPSVAGGSDGTTGATSGNSTVTVGASASVEAAPDLAVVRVAVETTDPRHISNVKSMDYRDVEPRRRLDYLSTSDNNGNNVDIEQESMLLLQNQLRYQLLARSVSGKFSRVKMVLR